MTERDQILEELVEETGFSRETIENIYQDMTKHLLRHLIREQLLRGVPNFAGPGAFVTPTRSTARLKARSIRKNARD